jgi:hypothetical protein
MALASVHRLSSMTGCDAVTELLEWANAFETEHLMTKMASVEGGQCQRVNCGVRTERGVVR